MPAWRKDHLKDTCKKQCQKLMDDSNFALSSLMSFHRITIASCCFRLSSRNLRRHYSTSWLLSISKNPPWPTFMFHATTMMYILEIQHGTQKRGFGRWFSFSIGWSLVSMIIFWWVVCFGAMILFEESVMFCHHNPSRYLYLSDLNISWFGL